MIGRLGRQEMTTPSEKHTFPSLIGLRPVWRISRAVDLLRLFLCLWPLPPGLPNVAEKARFATQRFLPPRNTRRCATLTAVASLKLLQFCLSSQASSSDGSTTNFPPETTSFAGTSQSPICRMLRLLFTAFSNSSISLKAEFSRVQNFRLAVGTCLTIRDFLSHSSFPVQGLRRGQTIKSGGKLSGRLTGEARRLL